MLSLKLCKHLLFALVLILSNYAFAVSDEMKAIIDWETHGNAVAFRSNEKVAIENYEIPLKLLGSDISNEISPLILNSMVFEKNGEKYVRWVINPEDTKWHLEVEEFLRKNNVSTTKHKFFDGYKTASRSYIVVNPETKAEFSVKVSTNLTGGNWTDKKQTFEDALQIRMIMKHIQEQVKKTGTLKRSILLDEPAVFGIQSLDQGMVIRAYDGIAGSGHRYLPGFSAVHDRIGREIALLNGSKDPAAFWDENYNKPLAKALAEFIATTGVSYDSPHSQNFMVELDANYKPTGKIVLRDFGDSYLNTQFMDAVGKSSITKAWEQANVLPDILSASVGILHGNKAPSWIDTVTMATDSTNSYQRWGLDFYKEFRKEFKMQTGLMLNSRNGPGEVTQYRSNMYFMDGFLVKDGVGSKFISMVRAGTQRSNFKQFYCESIFAN